MSPLAQRNMRSLIMFYIEQLEIEDLRRPSRGNPLDKKNNSLAIFLCNRPGEKKE